MAEQLFIGRLPRTCRSKDLEDIFYKYGRMTRCDVKQGLKMSYGFIEYEDMRDAEDAIHYEHGKDMGGSRIVVEWARGPKYDYRRDYARHERERENRGDRSHSQEKYKKRSRSRSAERRRSRSRDSRRRGSYSHHDRRRSRSKSSRDRHRSRSRSGDRHGNRSRSDDRSKRSAERRRSRSTSHDGHRNRSRSDERHRSRSPPRDTMRPDSRSDDHEVVDSVHSKSPVVEDSYARKENGEEKLQDAEED